MQTLKNIQQSHLLTNYQINAKDLLNGKLYIEGKGWQQFKLSDEFKEYVVNAIVKEIGGRSETKKKLYFVLKHRQPNNYALTRIVFSKHKFPKDKRKNVFKCTYHGAWNTTAELKELRKELLNEY